MRRLAAPLAVALLGMPSLARAEASSRDAGARVLSFEQRVDAQRAIESIYYSHQIGASRAFEEAIPPEILDRTVRGYLKRSAALERFWGAPVTAEALREETFRIARQTRMPERLRELFAALGGDPFVVQECLVRPVLVERLSRARFASDQRIHAAARRQAEALRARLASGEIDPGADYPGRRVVEIAREEEAVDGVPGGGATTGPGAPDPIIGFAPRRMQSSAVRVSAVRDDAEGYAIEVPLQDDPRGARLAVYEIPKRPWDDWWSEVSESLDEGRVAAVADASAPLPQVSGVCQPDDVWESGALVPSPTPRQQHTAVWTGSLMVVWGGVHFDVPLRSGIRYDPVIDAYTPVSTIDAPQASVNHTAVWTGSVMIIWGGSASGAPVVATGSRYDPQTDTWTPVSTDGAPSARVGHTAVWTGSRMIVWGGFSFGVDSETSSGGRYDPAADTWAATSTIGAAAPSKGHRAVWSGSVMIVWGGHHGSSGFLTTGGRYEPEADAWLPMSTTGAPSKRADYTMVWAGGRGVVWGGIDGTGMLRTGGRYDPAADAWTPTTTSGAPGPRSLHTAISTGGTMIVWGGNEPGATNSGARYDPAADSWTATTILNAPRPRYRHTAVWTGSSMIVWGGYDGTLLQELNSAGRYNPATNAWTPSAPPAHPSPRLGHTAVWTGSVMVIWGGGSATGSRYDPAMDSWSPTSTLGAPDPRSGHSAVWTGERMVVWGGTGPGDSSGGRYDPTGDAWAPMSTAGAPSPRSGHTAIWTGSRMVVWGGADGTLRHDSGGRYVPVADSWEATSVTGAPSARAEHTAVWTGEEMIVWGGEAGSMLATGGRYDPVADVWGPATQTAGAPAARGFHTAIWTGDEMVVWGGFSQEPFSRTYPAAGGRYHPPTNTWSSVTTLRAPAPRGSHTAVWTGRRMIVWGGVECTGAGCPYESFSFSTGGRYDPVQDAWEAVSTTDAPKERSNHTAVWTGSAMLVWGGQSCDTNGTCPPLDTGGRYWSDSSSDADGDTFRASCDCNDADASIWATPGEVPDVDFDGDGATMSWPPPSVPGAMAVVYDTLRSADPSDFAAVATCVETDDGGDREAFDALLPPMGGALFYLIRAENTCPAGSGSLGTTSSGAPRTGRTCP